MQLSQTLVSILLPVRNNEDTLSLCLESLLSQTYKDLEIIAIDDNSSDDSFAILRRYRKLDKRLHIYRNVKYYGLSVTLNRAIKKARGKYIAFMNPKDMSTTDRLKRQVNFLERNPKVAAVGTQASFVNSKGKKWGKSNFPTDQHDISRFFLHTDTLQLESIMINRYLLPKDLITFEKQKYPLIYKSLLAKVMQYGMIVNLNQYLYIRTKEEKHNLDEITTKIIPHVILWVKARFIYDGETKPTWNSLFSPLNNRIKSSL